MEEYLTQITDYLLMQSWQIAILVAVVAATSWLLRNKSAHVRYLLWLIVLAKCLVPPLLTIPLAVLPQEKPMLLLELDTRRPMIAEPVTSPPAPQVSPPVPVVVQPRTRLSMRQWLAIAWIAGVGAFVVVAVIKALQTICWLRRERKPLPAELHSTIEGLFRDFGPLPKLWLIEGIGQPFVWGLLRGSIYLPANFVRIGSPEHRRGILGHELGHIMRFDAAVNLLQAIAQAIFWFHPFVWWANKKIRAEREKCCDEMAIAGLGAKAKEYSTAIVNILISEHESTRRVPSLAVAGPVKNIEERIKTMLRPGKKFYKHPTLLAVITVVFLAILAVPTTLALTKRELKSETPTTQTSNLEVPDMKFEPIRQGKNVVHAEVRNTSPEDQVLAVYIQTRSPDRGWGTTFTDPIKAGRTKWIRHAYKIFDPITDDTWIRLQFYNPGPVAGFDQEKWFSSKPWDSWFKKVKHFGNDLEHYKTGESQLKPASRSQTQAITETLRQLQHHIKSEDYQVAWDLFTQDFREAEFQIRGFERFKECMEKPQNFYLSRTELLALQPKSVNIRNGIFTLTAAMRDEYRKVDLLNVDGKWKIDSIERVIPSELEVLDVEFEPIRQGKNVVLLKVRNTSDRDQTFGIDIRAEAPIRNWQRQFLDTIEGSETKSTSFDFEILGPITDAISIRLRFYNPPSADEFDINKWFKKIRYTYKDLDQLGILQERSEPASESQAEAVTNTFRQFQSCLKEGKYEAVWGLLTRHIRSSQFQDDFEKFKEQFYDDRAKTIFLNLYPESVTKSGKFLTLSAEDGDQTWKIHFIKEDGQWKIYEGQEPDRSNWQERLLPKMQKRVTKHFDIYYFKDSTAEKEIEQIAERKEKGFEQICQFLGKDSDVRIRMVLFEDGRTKQRETGHQGAGWAFGNTIVEVYNEKEKLDPYHETTHVLMRPFGNPPALFNEGFAVYMSERLGAQALRNLGGGPATIYQRVKELKKNNEWIELEELITYTEIGSSQSRPPISYAEAASFVKFLIEIYGQDKFLRAYETLQNSDEKSIQQQNTKTFERIYGQSLNQLEQKWIDTFSKD